MTPKIIRAQAAIQKSKILYQLKEYDPTVVSTIFVGFDLEDSDIDIICTYNDADVLANLIRLIYGDYDQFFCDIRNDHILSQFVFEGFLFEIYGSTLPVTEQRAFGHYEVMKRLSQIGGEPFQELMRATKRSGLKTEPAIASLFDLGGDPYEAVLLLNDCSHGELASYIQKCIR